MKYFVRIALLCFAGACASASAQGHYYLNCDGGSDSHDGLSPQSAWKTLAIVNSHSFAPGDTLVLETWHGVRRHALAQGLWGIR